MLDGRADPEDKRFLYFETFSAFLSIREHSSIRICFKPRLSRIIFFSPKLPRLYPPFMPIFIIVSYIFPSEYEESSEQEKLGISYTSFSRFCSFLSSQCLNQERHGGMISKSLRPSVCVAISTVGPGEDLMKCLSSLLYINVFSDLEVLCVYDVMKSLK